MNNTNQNNQSRDKNTITIILIVIIVFILFGITCFGLYQCYNRPCNCENCLCCENIDEPSEDNTSKKPSDAPDLDSNAGEYVPPEQSGVSKGVAIPGWEKIVIPAGQKDNIVVDFHNPIANKDLYYLTFEMRLPDDSEQGYEVLYKSGLIEADKHIQSISLSRALSAGEYDVILHVQPYRVSDKSKTNNADLKVKLIVK